MIELGYTQCYTFLLAGVTCSACAGGGVSVCWATTRFAMNIVLIESLC